MGYTLKPLVSVLMTPELINIVDIVDNILHAQGLHAVITSGNEGKHALESKHFRNQALDFRTYNWSDVTWTAERIQLLLGPNYDVVVEKDHLHVEYDPKRG